MVCLSRLVPRKGQDMLIRALPSIRQRVDGAALVIVGGGPYLDTLRGLADDCGVGEHVTFTGGVPAAELPAHHALADVFAMPCRTRGAGMDVEGLGIVFLEASATGVPVIAGYSGGAPETVRHNKTGLVVDGRSVNQVADAVTELLADRDRAAAMGAAGRRVGDGAVALGHAGRPAGRVTPLSRRENPRHAALKREVCVCSPASPWCRSPRCRRRTSRPPRCA